MSYEILTFHADPGGSLPTSPARGPTGPEMIDLMFRSARRHDSGVTLAILTTPDTDLSKVRVPYNRVDITINFDELMLERSRAQLRYLTQRDWSRPLVMLDSDILVNSAISPVFRTEFDIGLTWRGRPKPPINGGVFFLHNRDPDKLIRFFSEFVQYFENSHRENARWYGDQIALYELIGSPTQAVMGSGHEILNDVRICFFPCDTHNYTPHKVDIFKRLDRYLILHFKGERKWIMRAFWWIRVRWSRKR